MMHNDDIVELESRRGSIKMKAEVTPRAPSRVVFSTFHFHEAPVNLLTNPAFDPVSGIPEYKGCAVKVRRCA
jgi:predicted molibdopterin-dependent oxidoreductase YjgC